MTLYTVGHSRHAPETFSALLRTHGIATLVDVRSRPYSRWAPHFRKQILASFLSGDGIDYVFLGKALGGRPDGREFYDVRGRVDYGRRCGAPDFLEGISDLEEIAGRGRTAIMCAEEDPARCHRRLLIAPVLERRGHEVLDIRGDGHLEQATPPGLFQ